MTDPSSAEDGNLSDQLASFTSPANLLNWKRSILILQMLFLRGQDIILTGGFIAGSGGAGEEHGGCRHGDSTFGEGGCGFWDGSGCDLDLRTGGFITGSGGAGGGCGGCGGGGGGNFRLGRQGTLRLDCGFWVLQLLVTLA